MTTPLTEQKAALNTDRELWRSSEDYYSDSTFVTKGGGIGINVGGHVIVMPLQDWYAAAHEGLAAREQVAEIARLRSILVEANNHWRHEFAQEVDAATDKLFKRLAHRKTMPFPPKPRETE